MLATEHSTAVRHFGENGLGRDRGREGGSGLSLSTNLLSGIDDFIKELKSRKSRFWERPCGTICPPPEIVSDQAARAKPIFFFGITFHSGTCWPNSSGQFAIALELEARKDRENRAKNETTYQVLKSIKR